MFKALKEFFFGKLPVEETPAPYKTEAPVPTKPVTAAETVNPQITDAVTQARPPKPNKKPKAKQHVAPKAKQHVTPQKAPTDKKPTGAKKPKPTAPKTQPKKST